MIGETFLLEAIRESGITRIAIIDDAFDPPEVDDLNAGDVLEYLEGEAFASLRSEVGLSKEAHQRALQALRETDYESEELTLFIEGLYGSFIPTLDSRFDPGGIFEVNRGDNLRYVIPILRLLSKCGPEIEIIRFGSRAEDLNRLGSETHLIFVDFYLDPNLAVGEEPKGKSRTDAKAASLERLTGLLKSQAGQAPSVVLMSSFQVRDQADKYRLSLNKDRSRVFASRFIFIEKTQLELTASGEIQVQEEAADALLDIFQSYEFGRALHASLDCWLESAANAVQALGEEIVDLDLKDFAYLVRFRLAQEGQGLLEYLEWFFGECLLDSVGRAVDEKTAGDNRISALSGSAASRIEGAFDGPTRKVAELYHKVRIENPRTSRGSSNYKLGGLYLVGEGGQRSVVAVMTPDCDLIAREGGKRAAPRLLTVSGKLKGFDVPDSSVSDFVVINKKPFNISWNRKSVETKEFIDWPASGAPPDGPEYIGTLRPLYAQELQRNLLHDLGRVGVSVAPVLGMTASVAVVVKQRSGQERKLDTSELPGSVCYVVPKRGVADKSRVIFKRQFVRSLISALSGMDPDPLSPHAASNIAQLKQPNAYQRLAKMFKSGVALEEVVDLGIFLTAKPSRKESAEGTWCWLFVGMVSEG